jgi:hypothetical protein
LELAGYEGAIDADGCYQDPVVAAAWFLAPPPPSATKHNRKDRKEARR